MATRLLLVSDTHLPKRAKRMPSAVLAAASEVDLVIHAGDWVDTDTLDLLESASRELVGVWGNNDGPELRVRLPEIARVRVEQLDIAVVHETGAAAGRERRADVGFPGTDVLVFGHSHIPWDSTTPCGMRLLNPGSPTDRRRQPRCTMMLAEVSGGDISVALIPVDRSV
ncbi:metallophosphoesterase [Leucobacter sp. USCH14]|uniref:metallophosphoesterase family protein n=1 Tax=Leucobacter sp. USCH14 TaxID=3024838 RepID=UPI00309B2B1E